MLICSDLGIKYFYLLA